MIYIVEDDSSIRELVGYALHTSGYETASYTGGEELWPAMERKLPELILLDIMLPGEDGISILKKLKADARTSQIPVIMMTAKGEEYDKVLGLDSGADDYVAKPFGMMELISRVRAVLRRTQSQQTPAQQLCAGALTLDPSRHVVTVNGEAVNLTLKEFEMLRLLMEKAGAVVKRDDLLRKVWGYDYSGETRTVDVHVGTLRQKLGSCGGYIETVRGIGYKIGGGAV